jgi:hypothetical protein
MGLVTFLCLRFKWSWTITPTLTSPRMGGCVPRASIAQGSRGCYMTHSSVLATMGTLRSTVADCLRPTAWTSVRSAWWYPLTPQSHGRGPSSAVSLTPVLSWWCTSLSPPCARTTSPLLQHCLSRFFRLRIRRTPYGSSILRPCPTSRDLTSMSRWLHWPGTHSTYSTFSTTPLGQACSSVRVWRRTRRVPLSPPVRLRGWGMRMPSSVVVHAHFQSRTASYRRSIVALVTLSMDGTTAICCSTSLARRWRPVPTGLSTLRTMWRHRTPSLRRGRRGSPISSSSW